MEAGEIQAQMDAAADDAFSADAKKAQFAEALKGGASIENAAKAVGVARSTGYQWAKKVAPLDPPAPPEQDASPRGAAPPQMVRPPGKAGGKRGRVGSKPITEDTAQQLLAGLFFIPFMLTHEPEWPLTSEEKKVLGEPLADSLRALPAGLADAANTYSAPFIFLSSLGAVVFAKQNAIARRKRVGTRPTIVPPTSAPSSNGAPKPAADTRATEDAMRSAAENYTTVPSGSALGDEPPDPDDGSHAFTG